MFIILLGTCQEGTVLPVQYLNGFIGVCDQCDEQTEDHVDEQGHKSVQVETTVEPHHVALLLHVFEGREHVVTIDQGEQAL